MELHEPITLEAVRAAKVRITGAAISTPLVRLNVDDSPAEIFLKLENLQPSGAFKLRGAANAMRMAKKEQLEKGVWTVSSGNMALAVAWSARQLGVPCTVVVQNDAAETKLAAIARMGAKTIKVPYSELLNICLSHAYKGINGHFIHPFADPAVVAGNGTVGLEIIEALPDVEAIVVPYGGGGLFCGVASAVRALKPKVKLYAAEVEETGAPVAPSLEAGKPVEVKQTPTFVGGIGNPIVFPQIWPLASSLLDGSLVTSLSDVASTIKLIAERNHIIAEGAGAASVAAALAGTAGTGKVVCVVSGGNIDADKLAKILEGEIP